MNPSVQIAAVFVVLTSQLANAHAIKRDVLGISLGMPVAAVAKRDIVASAGEWTPPQEDVIPVGAYKCKKLGAPWKLSSGQLSCRIDKLSSLSLDVALLTDPPAIQSITHNFCSTDEPSKVLEQVYRDYGITSGREEANFVAWGPDYRLDSRTTLNIGYSGLPCSEGRAYELKLQDFQLRTQNIKKGHDLNAKLEEQNATKQQELNRPKRQERSISKREERKLAKRHERNVAKRPEQKIAKPSRLAASTRHR
jgi:hypothetical protein